MPAFHPSQLPWPRRRSCPALLSLSWLAAEHPHASWMQEQPSKCGELREWRRSGDGWVQAAILQGPPGKKAVVAQWANLRGPAGLSRQARKDRTRPATAHVWERPLRLFRDRRGPGNDFCSVVAFCNVLVDNWTCIYSLWAYPSASIPPSEIQN